MSETTDPTSNANEHIQWKFQTQGAIWGSAAVVGNTVFIGSDDGSLYAIHAETGKQKWSYQTGGVVRSRPALDDANPDNYLYFASDDGFLYGLNSADGTLFWRVDIGNVTDRSVREEIGSSPAPTGYDYVQSSPALSGGIVYVGSADGSVHAINTLTGDVLWTYQTGAQVRATPVVIDGTLYVGSWDMFMYALDAQTGALKWQTDVGGQVQSTALVHDNLVYTASRKASVVALDTTTGELVWEFDYGANMWVESSPILVDEMLYIGSSGSQMIYGIDSASGAARLVHRAMSFCWSKPLVLGSTLYIGCTHVENPHQGLFVLDIGTHPANEKSLALNTKWELPMGESLEISGFWTGAASSPIYADGTIYIGGLDGVLYAINE